MNSLSENMSIDPAKTTRALFLAWRPATRTVPFPETQSNNPKTNKNVAFYCRECVRNLDLRVQTISTNGPPWPGVSQRRRRREYNSNTCNLVLCIRNGFISKQH